MGEYERTLTRVARRAPRRVKTRKGKRTCVMWSRTRMSDISCDLRRVVSNASSRTPSGVSSHAHTSISSSQKTSNRSVSSASWRSTSSSVYRFMHSTTAGFSHGKKWFNGSPSSSMQSHKVNLTGSVSAICPYGVVYRRNASFSSSTVKGKAIGGISFSRMLKTDLRPLGWNLLGGLSRRSACSDSAQQSVFAPPRPHGRCTCISTAGPYALFRSMRHLPMTKKNVLRMTR